MIKTCSSMHTHPCIHPVAEATSTLIRIHFGLSPALRQWVSCTNSAHYLYLYAQLNFSRKLADSQHVRMHMNLFSTYSKWATACTPKLCPYKGIPRIFLLSLSANVKLPKNTNSAILKFSNTKIILFRYYRTMISQLYIRISKQVYKATNSTWFLHTSGFRCSNIFL